MALVSISSAPNQELYDRVSRNLDLEGSPPTGLLVHTAGRLDDGTIQIVQVFDSPEAMSAFRDERLLPAFSAAQVQPDPVNAPRIVETFHLVTA